MDVSALIADEILEVGGVSETLPVGCVISSGKYVLMADVL